MITCYLMGGLGNQLFQIFTVIAYSLKYKIPFVFSPTMSIHEKRHHYWDTFLLNLKPFTLKYSSCHGFDVYKEENFNYNEIPVHNNDQHLLLYGYFQSYKYFDEQFNDIIKFIKLDTIINTLLEKIQINQKSFDQNCISMHFRLGDYKNLPDHHPILKEEYYEKSLQYITEKTSIQNYNVYYFCESEDNDTVLFMINNLKKKFNELEFIKADDSLSDWEQMLIMSLCKHNIIANSSFSWWGAYLNKNQEKIVCYPSTWFGSKLSNDTSDMFPNEWIKN